MLQTLAVIFYSFFVLSGFGSPDSAFLSAPPERPRVKVIIVPGHDDEYPGAAFKGAREADLNLAIAKKLFQFLKADPAFEPVLVRDENGYLEPFLSYFESQAGAIRSFMNEHEAAFAEELREGRVKRLGGVPHNEAPDAVALRLFGLNKWAEENFADLVFHIHVNDYPRRHRALPGIHTGFAIYVPDRIYANHENSRAAAEYLFSRLKKVAPVSTYGLERSGIVLDQELISLGASRSLSRPALLVEYGYVYERRFAAPARAAHLERLAEETYFALLEYFTHRP